jgi:hypothetical protein
MVQQTPLLASDEPSAPGASGPGASGLVPRDPRSNAMLSAVLHYGDKRFDVFIRDVSSTGAMVEGKVLPPRDAELVLVRGDIQVGGLVIWQIGHRAGIKFDGRVLVADMMRRVTNTASHQARIDSIQRSLRMGGAEGASLAMAAAQPVERRERARDLSVEFGYAVRIVEALGDELTGDAYILSRYGTTLQKLDELAQLIKRIEGQAERAIAAAREGKA